MGTAEPGQSGDGQCYPLGASDGFALAGSSGRIWTLEVGLDAVRSLGASRRVAAGADQARRAARLRNLQDRQLDRARSPACGGSKKENGDPAIGRSRGGLSTKVHAVVDGNRLPIEVAITGGEVSDYQPAAGLLDGKFGRWIIADRGYDGDRIIALIKEQGSQPVIPPRANRHRGSSTRMSISAGIRSSSSSTASNTRRIATRYEKTARNYLAMVHIACLRLWSAL